MHAVWPPGRRLKGEIRLLSKFHAYFYFHTAEILFLNASEAILRRHELFKFNLKVEFLITNFISYELLQRLS